jgi:hypothetical protein
MGDAAQVPTQWSAGDAAVALAGVRERESRRRSERGALVVMAFLGVNMLVAAPSYRCFASVFRGGAGVDV